MTAMLPPMLLFSFYHHAVHGYAFFPSLPFCLHAAASCLSCRNYLIASYGLSLVCTCMHVCTYVNLPTIYMA